MDSKIQTLIEKLNLSKECIDCLKGAKLNRIVANKEKTNYCFYVNINYTLQVSLYEEFINRFALFGPFVVELKQVYRLFSSGFIHANFMHLLFNCYALFIMGSQIESFLGKTKYLVILTH